MGAHRGLLPAGADGDHTEAELAVALGGLAQRLSLIHISEATRRTPITYAGLGVKKKTRRKKKERKKDNKNMNNEEKK
ncbi:hypothetical protein, partial [Streptomyces sp. V2]|uniref:hypothetical protein n=1 Tax=Streptomyces sp. V2 TaxID=1424099 RepID=UPI0019D13646